MPESRVSERSIPKELPAGPTSSAGGSPRAVLTIVAGFALLAAGAIVLVPLPEFALPILAVGLRLLGRHYAWAKAANDKLDKLVRVVSRQWRRLPRPARIAILTALAACAALLIYTLAT